MPDRLDLDDRLSRSRADLLGEIDQPPLTTVRRRAGTLRRRRHTALTGGALAVLVATGLLAVRPWAAPDPGPAPAASPSVPAAPIYTGDGITINGLVPGMLADLPGAVVDAEFVDPDRGMVATGCGGSPGCTGVAVTADGGLTWTPGTPPADVQGDLDVVGFPRGALLLAAGDTAFTSPDGGRTWQPAPGAGAAGRPAAATREQILRWAPEGITVWDPVRGPLGALRGQPADFQPRWVASRPAGDGGWWAGGLRAGGPAVAVSRDGGALWTTKALTPDPGGVRDVRVGTLGRDVFAVATGDRGELRGIWHSEDGGVTFHQTYRVGNPGPAAVEGDPVPLLDGRLMVAAPAPAGDTTGGRVWLSDDEGTTFSRSEKLPAVGRLAATTSGFVAYGLFAGTWTAYSADGSTWRKLEVN